MAAVRHLWQAALNLLYPPRCCACAHPTEQPAFCGPCGRRITAPSAPLCPICGVPFGTQGDGNHRCGRCRQHRPRFGRARACAIYDASDDTSHPLKVVLHRYKYGREVSLAGPLGHLLTERSPLAVNAYDLIVPVPLHLARLRWRGFNQSHFLARRLAHGHSARVDPFSLQRVRPTDPQVQLNERQRRHNVRNAFCVVRPERVHRRTILLVDDVYTTGATANECSRVLLRAGARQVDVLVLARAVLS
jgi:ComF family protein